MKATPNLNKYVEYRNTIKDVFGDIRLDLRKPDDRAELREHIECDLSPENLCCDGELPAAAVVQKRKYLEAVSRELDSLA